MLGTRFLSLNKKTLFKIETFPMLNFFLPISWAFGVSALFVHKPLCDFFVVIFALFTFVFVGIRVIGLEMEVWSWLLRQFHHFYKLLQGLFFTVSFCFISKF